MSYAAYSIIVVVLLIAVLVWAIRSGQFKNQERARYLPLEDEASREGRTASPARRHRPFWTWLLVAAALLLAAAVVLRWVAPLARG